MIGFTPNEIPYKKVKKGDKNETSSEVDFDAIWADLLDESREKAVEQHYRRWGSDSPRSSHRKGD